MKTNQSSKRAIVTGASRGIGEATALLLSQKGVKVLALSRDETALKKLSAKASSAAIDTLTVDLHDPKVADRVFGFLDSRGEVADYLINNAGSIIVKPAAELTLSDWESTQQVNLRAPFLLSQKILQEAMSDHKKSINQSQSKDRCIVHISSLAGLQHMEKFAGFSAYSAAKAGLVALSQCLDVEGRPYGLRSNCIAPGAVDTQMLREAAPFLKTSTQPHDIAVKIVDLIFSKRSGEVMELMTNE